MDLNQSIITENQHWIAVNKPYNISVQPDKSGDPSLQDLVADHIGSHAYIINRIDRPVSGMVLFGKTAAVKDQFRELFATRKIKKYYLAITKEKPPKDRDKIHHYLRKNTSKNKSFVEPEAGKNTRDAYLIYYYLRSIEKYHLLKIRLITGRHHQIRAQLADIGCPIRGDVKYGYERANRVHSIQLHSWKLYFKDPLTEEHTWLYAEPPNENIWNAFDIPAIQQLELTRYGESNKTD